ncbi:hypothetical protein B2M26_10970 [Ferroacidibacillus organovorans]|uniref:Uncharacterized protein n=2 Tax=Ferroacidibacillus organovorans TaxID=1765683 RepID=A0A1V4ERM9_9BACL|nr:hypothetical protein B2M26_10970 [Ferroacidibacillus organovorans]
MMKWNDPIVEEVRATRERLLREAGGFEAYIKKLRTQELEHPQRLLSKDDLKSKESIPSRDN